MWKPNENGVNELISLFQECNTPDNKKQIEIYNKINMYSQEIDFSNYLVFIFTHSEIKIEIRQYAGLTLKGIMERSFADFTDENLEYFKNKILEIYSETNITIKRTISNLINTFIRLGGIDFWPELLEFLINNLNNEANYETAMETIQIIIEDSGAYIEDKNVNFLRSLIHKMIEFIQKAIESLGTNSNQINEKSVLVTLTTLHILIDNCPNAIYEELKIVSPFLLILNNLENLNVRINLGMCWNSLLKNNKDFIADYYEHLFVFFINNFKVDNYELNFSSAEFFCLVLDEQENIIANDKLLKAFEIRLNEIIPNVIKCMQITNNDICGMDSKMKENKCSRDDSAEREEEDTDVDEELEDRKGQSYNPNWTLRKCASKLLDRISVLFPKLCADYSKPILENDLQSQEWIVKEKAILALGACALGCYELLKPHLSCLIGFLIKELQHPNKFVRAITCWTISRYTRFVTIDNLSDNCFELFKDYLCEILKRFMDTEAIVQEAACTAFSVIILTKREKIEPFLYDVFKIITNVFNRNSGVSLLNLYDIFNLLTENFEEHFRNEAISSELIKCVVNKWYETINSYLNSPTKPDNSNVSSIFDMIIALVKAAGSVMTIFIGDFLDGTLNVLNKNYEIFSTTNKDFNSLDKDLITKCFDLISHIYNAVPNYMVNYPKKNKIVEFVFKYLEINENYLNHFGIALIGDIGRVDNLIFLENIKYIVNTLINYLEIPEYIKAKNGSGGSPNAIEPIEMEKLSVCNNSCWTLGILAISYPNSIKEFIHPIMKKLTKIISLPRLNKSLAQNVCICIGRCSTVMPDVISTYLDEFLKQFCLSLRNIKDSPEKQEAFIGLCKSIVFNPNGVINYFAFFCDAICQYESPAPELERMFQNLIVSFKNTLREKWFDYFKLFPEKLKIKMANRFKIN